MYQCGGVRSHPGQPSAFCPCAVILVECWECCEWWGGSRMAGYDTSARDLIQIAQLCGSVFGRTRHMHPGPMFNKVLIAPPADSIHIFLSFHHHSLISLPQA
jgi:hypothetical protein